MKNARGHLALHQSLAGSDVMPASCSPPVLMSCTGNLVI
jgi:hypothetical protein